MTLGSSSRSIARTRLRRKRGSAFERSKRGVMLRSAETRSISARVTFEQRTDDAVVANRMNAAQRRDAAAGHHPHHHRLGLIVLLMRGGDERVAGDLAQPRMPHLARRRLDAAMPDGLGIERAVGDAQRDVVPRAELAHVRLVVIRFRAAKMMIDVRGGEFDIATSTSATSNAVESTPPETAATIGPRMPCSREEAADGFDDHCRLCGVVDFDLRIVLAAIPTGACRRRR